MTMMMTTTVAGRVTAMATTVAAAAVAAAATTTTMMKRTTTAMVTTIASLVTIASLTTIESTGAAVVLLPHGAEQLRPCCRPAVKRRPRTPRAKAGDFELHQRADVRAFVLCRGRRDDGAVGVVVIGGDGGARCGLHRSRQRRQC